MGDTLDLNQAEALPAGSFFAMSPGMVHFAATDEDTVLQLNSIGPWSITYVNPDGAAQQKSK